MLAGTIIPTPQMRGKKESKIIEPKTDKCRRRNLNRRLLDKSVFFTLFTSTPCFSV